MTKYLLKTAGLSAIVCMLHTPVSAQQNDEVRTDTAFVSEPQKYDEIVIVRKGDKDAKISVEIKDGKVYINGKPSNEYKDGNVTIRSRKTSSPDGDDMDGFTFIAPPASPFRKRSGATSIAPQAWGQSWSSRAFLGVTSRDDDEGARVTEVSKGSAAEKVGLKPDDLITRIDEIKIDGPESLSEAVHKYKPEDKITITFKRDGKEQKVTAVLGKSKSVKVQSFNYSMPNLDNLDNLNFDIAPRAYGNGYFGESRGKLGIKAQDTEDGKGVKVLEVGDESAAEKAGIKEGDIITRFDGKEIESATALAAMARASKDKSGAKLSIIRDGKPMDIDVRLPRKLKTADL